MGSVQAKDLDQTTEFNRISYSIIEGSFGSFILRTFAEEWGYRGNLTVDPDVELDYESALKQFKLRVEAADLDGKKAEVEVDVHVVDVNDERPEFTAPTVHLTVKENTTIIGAVGNFTARDKDGNHSLVYELESINCRCNGSLTPCSWFILDPTGEVRVNPEHTVDYEKCDQVVMEAQVVDEYTEKGENNSMTTGKQRVVVQKHKSSRSNTDLQTHISHYLTSFFFESFQEKWRLTLKTSTTMLQNSFSPILYLVSLYLRLYITVSKCYLKQSFKDVGLNKKWVKKAPK